MHVRASLRVGLFLLCIISGALAWGQSGAVIHGTVADPDDAVIPGATVTFTPAAGQALLTTSQADGGYTLNGVPAGLYAVTVTMKGFATYVKQGGRIMPNQQLTLDVKMAIQEQSQQVQVDAQSNQLSTDSDANASATIIKDKDLDALSDDPDELSSELSALAGPASGPSGGQIYVDGFTGGQLPPKSSIREIRINQNPFSAQFDKIGYGRVEVFTKPGTDKFHGNYSIQGGDNHFNTSNPFLGSANVQPPYHTLFMIGSITGPINRFSSFSVGGSNRTIQSNNIVNPTNFYADPANPTILCAPLEPASSPCQITGSYPSTARAVFNPQTRSDFTPRVDLALGEKNTLTARYQYYVNGQQNAGVGNTSLQSVGYSTDATENTVQLSDTQLISSHVINETRFEYERDHSLQTPNSTDPTVSVQGIVTGGGSSLGLQQSTSTHIEAQNYTSVQLAKHFMRLGGRLRTTQESLTSNAGSNGTFTYTSLANYITGTSQQFRQTIITNPTIANRLTDVGIYAEDDWKARPNLTISYGLRYEAQNVIHSNHDLAPRFALSYGVPHHGKPPVTVLRAGYGIFYDRFQQSDVLTSIQYNGLNQSQNLVQSPNPATCQPGALAGCGGGASSNVLGSTIYTLAPNLRSSYNQQAAFGMDQQLGRAGTVSVNYITAKGIHQYLSRAITNDQGSPSATSYNNQYLSGGYYEEQQLLVNSNIRMKKLQLFGFYSLNFANANTGSSTTFATDVDNRRIDYGNASFVHRNFAVVGGSYQVPWHISLSPFLLAQSGTFYNITTGTDRNFDGQFNDRPYFVNGNHGNCRNAADYSLTQNAAGTLIQVPINYCVGPANSTINLRVAKTIGFGPKTKPAAGAAGGANGQGGGGRGGRGGGPGGPGGGPGGGGPGGGFGSSNTGRRYNLSLGAQGSNIFNQVPYGTPNSVVSSAEQFGRFTTLAGRPFSTSNAVRQVTLQANFTF